MTAIITVFERAPDGGKGPARGTRDPYPAIQGDLNAPQNQTSIQLRFNRS